MNQEAKKYLKENFMKKKLFNNLRYTNEKLML